jgi:RNA polymerase sigma-70 factor (ECF subfamily)
MSHGTTTDLNACLEQLRAGDPRARDALIARAQERLRRLTRRLLNDFARVRPFEETDDILQNAQLRLLRRLEAHTPATAAAFFAAAAQEVRRELLDLVRHYFGPLGRGRREVAPPPADSADGQTPDADPSQHTHEPSQLVQWTELHEQVERLPDDERAVFDLLWYHGLTRPEAAAVLGVSEPTVKRRWLAARLRLQAALHLDGDPF